MFGALAIRLPARRLPAPFRAAPLSPGVRRFCAAAAVLAVAGVLSPVRLGVVSGESMQPTLQNGQPFLYQAGLQQGETLKRGQVVLVRLEGSLCVKRIAGLGGERLWAMTASKEDPKVACLIASDQKIEAWRARFPALPYREVVLPPGTVYVVGDAPCSRDSRHVGPVPVTEVVGTLRWPVVASAAPEGVCAMRLIPRPTAKVASGSSRGPVRIASARHQRSASSQPL